MIMRVSLWILAISLMAMSSMQAAKIRTGEMKKVPDFSRKAIFRMFVEDVAERRPSRPTYESGVTLYRSAALALRFVPLAPPLRVSSVPYANVSINPPVDPFVLTHTFP